MIVTLYPEGKENSIEMAQEIVKECAELLQEPEKSKAKPATKILSGLIAASRESGGGYVVDCGLMAHGWVLQRVWAGSRCHKSCPSCSGSTTPNRKSPTAGRSCPSSRTCSKPSWRRTRHKERPGPTQRRNPSRCIGTSCCRCLVPGWRAPVWR